MEKKTYHIETNDGFGSFNFFTEAEGSKDALLKLQANSIDFKKIVKEERDLVITIKHVK